MQRVHAHGAYRWAGDDPRAQALQGLRAALLDPGEVNPVSEYLRGTAPSAS